MAVNVRSRRAVANIFGDQAKARLVGGISFASSGSEHDAEDDSPCLSELIQGFLEDDDWSSEAADRSLDDASDSDLAETVDDCMDEIADTVRQSLAGNADSYSWILICHVHRATEAFAGLRSDKCLFRRRVMSSLRETGHNAAICKTKWSSTGGLSAGNFEFIDVVQSSSAGQQIRYVIDLDFAGEFEVARPTDQYSSLLTLLPRIFVGKTDDLKRILRAMSDAARQSLKSRGLSLSPWRKNRYVQNKWLGQYRRTMNRSPSSSSLTPAVSTVDCRAVGFDGGINGGRVVVRTR